MQEKNRCFFRKHGLSGLIEWREGIFLKGIQCNPCLHEGQFLFSCMRIWMCIICDRRRHWYSWRRKSRWKLGAWVLFVLLWESVVSAQGKCHCLTWPNVLHSAAQTCRAQRECGSYYFCVPPLDGATVTQCNLQTQRCAIQINAFTDLIYFDENLVLVLILAVFLILF